LLRELFAAQAGQCYLCSGTMTLELGQHNTAEVEHIVPKFVLARSGVRKSKLNPFNVAAAGSDCNRYKDGKPLFEVIHDLQRMRLCEAQDNQQNTPNASPDP
jgi:hypothetical protein